MARPTVLVVEDDTAIRRGLVDMLGYAGYEALECDNGRSALELATECGVDLVLLDVMLPRQDGFSSSTTSTVGLDPCTPPGRTSQLR